MSAAVFAYVVILRGAQIEKELLALLTDERRAEVQAILEKLKGMPPAEVRTLLKQLRNDQLKRQCEDSRKRMGARFDRVSPRLRAWLTRPF